MSPRSGVLIAVLALAACKPNVVAGGDLDRLETALVLTPAQRPAWNAFRREAEAADAGWRRELRAVLSADRFDARRARGAADQARADADRLIAAWKTLDDVLSPAQRAALRAADAD